eukprot:247982_1
MPNSINMFGSFRNSIKSLRGYYSTRFPRINACTMFSSNCNFSTKFSQQEQKEDMELEMLRHKLKQRRKNDLETHRKQSSVKESRKLYYEQRKNLSLKDHLLSTYKYTFGGIVCTIALAQILSLITPITIVSGHTIFITAFLGTMLSSMGLVTFSNKSIRKYWLNANVIFMGSQFIPFIHSVNAIDPLSVALPIISCISIAIFSGASVSAYKTRLLLPMEPLKSTIILSVIGVSFFNYICLKNPQWMELANLV